MLDRSKLLQEINKYSGKLFRDYSQEFIIAKEIWQKISQDSDFNKKIKDIAVPWLLPTWHGNLSYSEKIEPQSQYTILSCDGSQIYPDRHQGTSCFLINIGTVKIDYAQTSQVKFNSFPFLFSQSDEDSIEIVDCKRQEYEFQFGIKIMEEEKQKNNDKDFIFLFDGSLIFWHLESKSANVGQEYLGKYLGLLHQFYKEDLMIAGYISLPKSKELVNLIRTDIFQNNNEIKIDNVLDLHIASFYLDKFHRSILFKNHSPITQHYPSHLHPHFFYLNVGEEIVRIEIPEWIAKDEKKVDIVSQIIVDQCIKGHGFPICLAEAHEQAVVKSIDRDFFYTILQKLNIEHKQKIFMSQKSMKKKFMGI
jgi:hypothetical protein